MTHSVQGCPTVVLVGSSPTGGASRNGPWPAETQIAGRFSCPCIGYVSVPKVPLRGVRVVGAPGCRIRGALATRPLIVEVAACRGRPVLDRSTRAHRRSEEHTSELQSLMRISYAVFCLKKKK